MSNLLIKEKNMKLVVSREQLLKPLQLIIGVIERRQTLPVLANVLIVVDQKGFSLSGTDLEVEISGRVNLSSCFELGEITVPARKLMDICRSLPDQSELTLVLDQHKLKLSSGRSRFTLSTLPANDFPASNNDGQQSEALSFSVATEDLRYLINRTAFAMAHQDVRYYLNGMLFELTTDHLRSVATDGHRLATCQVEAKIHQGFTEELSKVILPRKGVLELARLINETETDEVAVRLWANRIEAVIDHFTFGSKLIEGKFPDYGRVIPKNPTKRVVCDRAELRQALTRAAILSNEKYRGVRFELAANLLKILANNPEQEVAEEEVVVDYQGDNLEIGFNVSYLLDVLAAMGADKVHMGLTNADSSTLLQEETKQDSSYVIMPMRV
jgi:DNA polymerase-3 subunit beta